MFEFGPFQGTGRNSIRPLLDLVNHIDSRYDPLAGINFIDTATLTRDHPFDLFNGDTEKVVEIQGGVHRFCDLHQDFEVGRPLLGLVKEPGVLQRHGGLIGEIPEELDLIGLEFP